MKTLHFNVMIDHFIVDVKILVSIYVLMKYLLNIKFFRKVKGQSFTPQIYFKLNLNFILVLDLPFFKLFPKCEI